MLQKTSDTFKCIFFKKQQVKMPQLATHLPTKQHLLPLKMEQVGPQTLREMRLIKFPLGDNYEE